jgi:UMF1 family MFS transporter
MGACIGILIGSLWTTTRPFLLSMTPEGEEGRVFGLYAFCNKTAAVIGPQIWGITVILGASLGTDRYRLAILVLAAVAALGTLLLHRIPPRRAS